MATTRVVRRSEYPLEELTATPVPIHEASMQHDELKAKLRPIFDKFDTDGSGAVSKAEMQLMVAELKLEVTDEQLTAIMADADPDGSGEIDFDEFVTALRAQMQGGGGLANIFTSAAGTFGWLNPLAWFGGTIGLAAPAAAPAAPAATPAAASSTRPKRSSRFPTPTWAPFGESVSPSSRWSRKGGASVGTRSALLSSERMRRGLPPTPLHQESSGAYAVSPRRLSPRFSSVVSNTSSVRAGSPSERSQRLVMKSSQLHVIETNVATGDELRSARQAMIDFKQAEADYFFRHQRQQIKRSHHQGVKATLAVEECKAKKSIEARDLKADLQTAYAQQIAEKAAHAAMGRRQLLELKAAHEQRIEQTSVSKHQVADTTRQASQVEKAVRRGEYEEVTANIASAAKMNTARVRHETRREVRQEGRDMFQEQRDAAFRDGKELQQRNREAVAEAKRQHLERQASKRAETKELRAISKAAQRDLVESRKADALAVRKLLVVEGERMRQLDGVGIANRRQLRDTIHAHEQERVAFKWWGSAEYDGSEVAA